MIDVRRRIWVDRGLFIDAVDLGGASSYSAWWPEPYQVYTLEGEPVRESYRGPGAIVRRDGARFLILGDPYATTTLYEYRLADEPTLTEDERREREQYRAGFAAGVDWRRKRKTPNAPSLWREGWDAGRRAIGRTP